MEEDARSELITQINRHLTLRDLQSICFYLNVDYDEISGNTKRETTRELVLYMARRNRLPELAELLRQERPKVQWPEISKIGDGGITKSCGLANKKRVAYSRR